MFASNFIEPPSKEALVQHYVGKSLDEVPTPAFVIDRKKFLGNAIKMLDNAFQLNADFRAHVKTHKTLEGAIIQLQTGKESYISDKIIVSTMAEAWKMVPLAEQGIVKDILYGVPFAKSKILEIFTISQKYENFRLMIDNVNQLDLLLNSDFEITKKWSVFIKIDMGYSRCGVENDSDSLKAILAKLKSLEDKIELYGFYCHCGHSYLVNSPSKAKQLLIDEIRSVNEAAWAALEYFPGLPLQLSVGATPTAHASKKLTIEELNQEVGELTGNLELHAGNYPCCDLQQLSTGCIQEEDISCRVIAEVVSTYPGRGSKAPGEQLINAGVIALSREQSAFPGFGLVAEPKQHSNWIVGRVSQEHGILVPYKEGDLTLFIPEGTRVSILPQHACIAAMAYPWYYVVDGPDNVIRDIWVPAKGW